jgi:PAS domain S-box-containing protein
MESIMAALRVGDIRIIDVDPATNAALADQPGDLEQMERTALRWWVNIPLMDGEVLLGSLGLGMREHRLSPRKQVAFLAALGERAARGLANTQLIEELRHTRARLEGILSALSEAVTVNDAAGHVVYANDAAVRLLGASSVEEVLSAKPGELAARFDVTSEDGTPVTDEEFPGNRILAGLDAPPLLTRSVHKRTGRASWLLTKATLLEGDESLAVNIIEDVTELKEAESRLRALGQDGAAD